MKNILKYIYLAVFICIVILLLVVHKNAPYRACRNHHERILKLELQAVVIDRFKDTDNHGFETVVVLQNNKEITFLLYGDNSSLFDSICVGDSIYKELNSMEVLVIRHNIKKAFTIDIDCNKVRK
ncbi:MAG: hypothetical protein PHW83_11290 [Bacteroidales bacterium]|nr:hypothetical protein [Bacteroidales bacterium]